MNGYPPTYRLDRLDRVDELRQTTPAGCVYLTVRYLVQYGLALEDKTLQGSSADISAFELRHQGGGYYEAIQHFTVKGHSKDGCTECCQEHLKGTLSTSDFKNYLDAKSRIEEQLRNGLPVVFTVQNPGLQLYFHSYAITEMTDQTFTYISPGNPPTTITREWSWLEAEWNRETHGGKDLAWYVPLN